jgi:hypothetical protein
VPDTSQKIHLRWAVGFGIVGLAVILTIALLIPEPTLFQYQVFRIILALAAGGAASMIPGVLKLQIPSFITGGGALAVFVVVYFYSPAQLAVREISPSLFSTPTPTPAPTSTPTPSPTPTPTPTSTPTPSPTPTPTPSLIYKLLWYNHFEPQTIYEVVRTNPEVPGIENNGFKNWCKPFFRDQYVIISEVEVAGDESFKNGEPNWWTKPPYYLPELRQSWLHIMDDERWYVVTLQKKQ